MGFYFMKADGTVVIKNMIDYCQSIENILIELDYNYDDFVSNDISTSYKYVHYSLVNMLQDYLMNLKIKIIIFLGIL